MWAFVPVHYSVVYQTNKERNRSRERGYQILVRFARKCRYSRALPHPQVQWSVRSTLRWSDATAARASRAFGVRLPSSSSSSPSSPTITHHHHNTQSQSVHTARVAFTLCCKTFPSVRVPAGFGVWSRARFFPIFYLVLCFVSSWCCVCAFLSVGANLVQLGWHKQVPRLAVSGGYRGAVKIASTLAPVKAAVVKLLR